MVFTTESFLLFAAAGFLLGVEGRFTRTAEERGIDHPTEIAVNGVENRRILPAL